MNLNQNPTSQQLSALLAACDDNAGTHILWVDHLGKVSISRLEDHETPAQWAARMRSQIRFRYESYAPGNGYVGPEVASDQSYVNNLLRNILNDWDEGKVGRVDF